MQLTINNWATTLVAPAPAASLEMTVAAQEAARLGAIDPGDYYAATLARVAAGIEAAWEIVHITAISSGTLTVLRGREGTTAIDWQEGESISVRVTAGLIDELRGSGGGSSPALSDALPVALGAASAGTGAQASRADHRHPLPTAAAIGAATAAQGAKADTAVQPGALAAVATSGSYNDLSGKPTIPSTAAQVGAIASAEKGAASGVATLDASSKIPLAQLPATAITDTSVVASQAAMLALTAQTGDVAIRTDINTSFILRAEPASTLENWQEILAPSAGGGASVGNSVPQALGTASPGVSASASRQDHVHAIPTAAQVGAAAIGHSHAISDTAGLQTALDAKQPTLVSNVNIKTVGGKSLLGPGDLTVGGGGTVGLIEVYEEAPVDPPEYQLFMVVIPTDTEPPEVTAFTATSGVASPVPITSFTATDNVGVTGYWVGTSSAEPALGDPGWSATPQTSFATASAGSVTLYARARDAAGNISAAVSQVVVIEDAYYDISWPYDSAIHTGLFSVAAGSFTTDSAIPVTPPTAMTIKSVMIPMRRQVEASYPGTGTVQLQVRSGSATGTVLATATAVVSPSGAVEVKTFTLPSNLSLAAGTTYFFTLSLVSQTGGDAVYRILADASTGSTWSRYNAGAWTSYVAQSPIRLEKV